MYINIFRFTLSFKFVQDYNTFSYCASAATNAMSIENR
jgi:hypothetical protein